MGKPVGQPELRCSLLDTVISLTLTHISSHGNPQRISKFAGHEEAVAGASFWSHKTMEGRILCWALPPLA